MAARNPSSSCKLQTLVTLLCRYKVMSGGPRRSHQMLSHNLPPYNGGSGQNQGLRVTSMAHSQLPKLITKKNELSGELPESPVPPTFGFSNWVKWLLGSIVSFLLPFWKNKWDGLLTLEEKAAKAVEEVEMVAEMVEKAATTADKALEEVANQLPDNTKLKEAAQLMEHITSVAAHDAQLVENIINKVDDVKQDLQDLGEMVEPIVDKIVQGKNTK